MAAIVKLMDAILLTFFLIITIIAPVLDAQICLPSGIFPEFLVDLKNWYTHEYGDYLVAENPHFLVGLVWVELLFAWPLSIVSIYGIVGGKTWVHTTCLMFGVSSLTAMAAILSELLGSGRAPEKLLKMHYPIMGVSVLAILRGLVPHSQSSKSIGSQPALIRKKRA